MFALPLALLLGTAAADPTQPMQPDGFDQTVGFETIIGGPLLLALLDDCDYGFCSALAATLATQIDTK